MKTPALTVRLPADARKILDDRAKQTGVPKVRIIADALRRLTKKEKK